MYIYKIPLIMNKFILRDNIPKQDIFFLILFQENGRKFSKYSINYRSVKFLFLLQVILHNLFKKPLLYLSFLMQISCLFSYVF